MKKYCFQPEDTEAEGRHKAETHQGRILGDICTLKVPFIRDVCYVKYVIMFVDALLEKTVNVVHLSLIHI